MIWRLGAILVAFLLIACNGEDSPSSTPSSPPGFEEISEAPPECVEQNNGGPYFEDGTSIANEVLSEETGDREFDRGTRDDLAAEIHGVLGQLRSVLPVAAEIHAPRLSRWQVTVYLTREASLRLRGTNYTQLEGTLAKMLGAVAFDAIGEPFGVKAMRMRYYENSSGASIELCLNDTANPRIAVYDYESLQEVETAQPPGLAGDSPMLDMRKRDETWYVVVREASGDCPAGCINEMLHFLTVDAAGANTVSEAEAAKDSLFSKLVKHTRRNDNPWPSPTATPVVS